MIVRLMGVAVKLPLFVLLTGIFKLGHFVKTIIHKAGIVRTDRLMIRSSAIPSFPCF